MHVNVIDSIAQDKTERLAAIHEGREDRGKFGTRKAKMDEHASTTNREKAKHKNPHMIKHREDHRVKQMLSLRDKQVRQSCTSHTPHHKQAFS